MAEVKFSDFVESALEPHPSWKVQSFEYYAAHFLVGSGLIYGDLDGHVRSLAHELRKQYDVGVQHGGTCPLEYTSGRTQMAVAASTANPKQKE